MRKSTKVVALDIRKDPITAVLAGEDRKGPRLYGTMPLSTGEALSKLADPWDVVAVLLRGRSLWIRRLPSAQGPGARLHGGDALADPPQAGRPHQDKTDRRDALSLARLFRNGELTPVWVPDEAQEAMRDLERCREDFKHTERRIRQRLNSFLLRHGRIYPGRSRWTQRSLSLAGEARHGNGLDVGEEPDTKARSAKARRIR